MRSDLVRYSAAGAALLLSGGVALADPTIQEAAGAAAENFNFVQFSVTLGAGVTALAMIYKWILSPMVANQIAEAEKKRDLAWQATLKTQADRHNEALASMEASMAEVSASIRTLTEADAGFEKWKLETFGSDRRGLLRSLDALVEANLPARVAANEATLQALRSEQGALLQDVGELGRNSQDALDKILSRLSDLKQR